MKKQFYNMSKTIRARRKEIGMTQETLSHRMGYNNAQFVSNLERGLNGLPAAKIYVAADTLDMTPRQLIEAELLDLEVWLDTNVDSSIFRSKTL